MTTAAAKKPRARHALDILMTPEEFIRALLQQEDRYCLLESGLAGDSEQLFLWERNGILQTLGRDSRSFADYMTARRLSEEPKCSAWLLKQPNPASEPQVVRTLWCRVPIVLTPLETGRHVQNQYKRLDTASESDAWATLRQAEVPPNVILHEGNALVGLWRLSLDTPLPSPLLAEPWLHALSRSLPGAAMGSAKDLLHLPSDAARLTIVPRHEVFSRWLGERDGTCSLGELQRWLFPAGVPEALPARENSSTLTAAALTRQRPY